MTVSNTSPIARLSYSGPGRYDFDFLVYDVEHVVVQHISTTGVVTPLERLTDYNVTLNVLPDPGGYVDMINPTASGGIVEIRRAVPLSQETQWDAEGGLDLEKLEQAQDTSIMIIQQIDAVVKEGVAASNWRGDWVANGTLYSVKDVIKNTSDGNWYYCIIQHNSAALFSTDLAASRWTIAVDTTGWTAIRDDAEAAQAAAEAAQAAAEVAQEAAELAEANAETAETNAEAARAAAELAISNSKEVESPDGSLSVNYTATKVQLAVNKDFSTHVFNEIIGGDGTLSGNTVTYNPCKCWNHARTVFMDKEDAGSYVIPSDANAKKFIFLVQLSADSSFAYRGYDNMTDVTADLEIAAGMYRWVDWRRNNSSGVAIASYLKNGILYNLKASESAVNSPTAVPANCNTAVDLSSFLPMKAANDVSLVEGTYMGASGATDPQILAVGVDGTNALHMLYSMTTSNGDTDIYSWGNGGSSPMLPLTNKNIYWGRGSAGAAGTHKLLLYAIKLRRDAE